MQLLSDAVTVLGSRHGLLWNPIAKECGVIRFSEFTALPLLHLRAGVVIDGNEYLLPLCPEGGQFAFCDQRMTPCTMSLIGIDPDSAIKLKLTVTTPFRPRDLDFSTVPVIGLRLEAESLPGSFRWHGKTVNVEEAEIFLEFAGPVQVSEHGEDALDLRFYGKHIGNETLEEHDRLLVTQGTREDTRFTRQVSLNDPQPLDVAWCTWSAPALQIQGTKYPFRYAEQFADLDAVCEWARRNPDALRENAERVDDLVGGNTFSRGINRLLAQTLHSWLADSWCVNRDGRDWFSVWEGSCYFHSTVDVEYTQAPFYLAVWPELLRSELEFWPEYSKDGTKTLGERGAGTLFLSHDVGHGLYADRQAYPHEMEVEETVNYLILSFAYWRRTGDDSTIRQHAEIIEKYLAFLLMCDTTGNGIPDQGVANTIDDASPAVQFGEEQVYLAVKTLAAYRAGAEMLELLGKDASAYRALADTVRTAIAGGWLGDHFATLLKKGGQVRDAWTGAVTDCEEIPGWDGAHIYTQNGLALLDMIGCDLGLNAAHLATDLRVATARCLREYGCVHTDFTPEQVSAVLPGLAGSSLNPGWVSMNMLRDIAAFYRGVDLRHLADRYWEWQTTTNSQEPKLFFETFNGNNLCFYPRGIAIWGFFDALAGRTIDRVAGVDREQPPFPGVTAPRLLDAAWSGVKR